MSSSNVDSTTTKEVNRDLKLESDEKLVKEEETVTVFDLANDIENSLKALQEKFEANEKEFLERCNNIEERLKQFDDKTAI
ncbi:hypothetical protein KAFR_0D01530 [Kazachstania africana CBS 2517]|uniref:Uncharacterized protein n=1 Tax=Kazachstania africana (strain ATCC 22294 / BCRC 22015 / CBS 2517 / CECT 1963 / NBRC 1671 / NRRL Y-8276) TaxID=1071382 RepID=H2ATU9_KAZAF|nr:hypothetical protein KAFR_0D01530 [Kazachstania africana CBS 2517]CCF57799.1 hypothetical protein KAFR_0D01530 [Kazachstania africana CBS 2517]